MFSSFHKMKAISVSRLQLLDSPWQFPLSGEGIVFDLEARERERGYNVAAVCSPSGEANIKEAKHWWKFERKKKRDMFDFSSSFSDLFHHVSPAWHTYLIDSSRGACELKSPEKQSSWNSHTSNTVLVGRHVYHCYEDIKWLLLNEWESAAIPYMSHGETLFHFRMKKECFERQYRNCVKCILRGDF